MVLLKNDGTLPLKKSGSQNCAVGPLADQTRYLLGNYNGRPDTHGFRAGRDQGGVSRCADHVLGGDAVLAYGRRCRAGIIFHHDGWPAGTHGRNSLPGRCSEWSEPYWRERQVNNVDLKAQDIPQEASGKYPLRVEWTGFLTPTETGDYTIGVRFQGGFARVAVDGKPLAAWMGRQR